MDLKQAAIVMGCYGIGPSVSPSANYLATADGLFSKTLHYSQTSLARRLAHGLLHAWCRVTHQHTIARTRGAEFVMERRKWKASAFVDHVRSRASGLQEVYERHTAVASLQQTMGGYARL